MLDAHGICSDGSWGDWNDQKLFESLYSAFPKFGDQMPFESIESRLKKIKMSFKLDQGANSLLSFTRPVEELMNTLDEDSLTEEFSKGLLKILMSRFPEDDTHKTLKELVKEGGEPTSISQFISKLMKMGVRLNKSYNDMKRCGQQHPSRPDKSREEKKELGKELGKQASRSGSTTSSSTIKHTQQVSDTCNGCGKKHRGECLYKTHPDFNATSKPFSESAPGKAWKAKGENSIPWNKTLSGASWKKPSSGELISVIHEADNAISIFPALIITPSNSLNINVLLDTGAMQGNYISEEIAEWLKAQGATPKCCSTTVCSAFKGEICYKTKYI